MKNKEKYDLRYITLKPKYKVTGCGKRITDSFTFDIYFKEEKIAQDIKAKDKMFNYFLEWLEEKSPK